MFLIIDASSLSPSPILSLKSIKIYLDKEKKEIVQEIWRKSDTNPPLEEGPGLEMGHELRENFFNNYY